MKGNSIIWSSFAFGEINELILCPASNISRVFVSAVPFDLKKNDAGYDLSNFVIAIKLDDSLDGGVTNEFVKNNRGLDRHALEHSRLL